MVPKKKFLFTEKNRKINFIIKNENFNNSFIEIKPEMDRINRNNAKKLI